MNHDRLPFSVTNRCFIQPLIRFKDMKVYKLN